MHQFKQYLTVYSPSKNKGVCVSETAAWVMKRSASGKADTVEPHATTSSKHVGTCNTVNHTLAPHCLQKEL